MSRGIRNLIVSVPTERLAADLGPLPEGVELVVWSMDGPAPRDRFDIVVPPYMKMARVLARLEGVPTRLVQSQSIGYEGVEELLPDGLAFANASSVHETSTAELAVGLAIAAQRRIDAFALDTGAGRWAPAYSESLADRRVLLLGYGGVGKAVAARLVPFEVRLTAVASRARMEDGMPVHGVDELPELLPDAEIVILTLPGGESTRRMVDDAFLAALPDGALVVNVGRGTLVDTDALVDHVRRGRVRAALDVTDPEPLPEGHPLWSLPGVLITPHVGGDSSAMAPRIARLVRAQIERMSAGDEPLNVVIGG
ncbi:2-hydroxyacid dehydrogenase [Microbacterium sp. CFBP9034]|uniref:2-hydroxyacid dehydrogenase n=1 Tax=Microbacterium sp. CFBP9034 TaxID=3096540 RepID=UPI002A698AC8|nr:2-hydroxyacid dehydrogenase [Microbacterium sp. CFBP9034]MDY0908018.1 2-hydroxyacid dehydrogenase [Microbacterium sp. CFBP9034]